MRFLIEPLVPLLFLLMTLTAPAQDISSATAQISGTLHGHDEVFYYAQWKEGNFHVMEEDDPFEAAQIAIHTQIDPTVIPENKTIEVDFSNMIQKQGLKHFSIRYVPEGASHPKYVSLHNRETRKNHPGTMTLAFGEEKERGWLPGRFSVSIPDLDTKMEGRFRAEIKGVRMIDGHPDPRSNSFITFQYLAKQYLQAQLDRSITEIEMERGSFQHQGHYPDQIENPFEWGQADYFVTLEGQASPVFARLQFKKNDEEWYVANQLKANQLPQAHPLDPGDAYHRGRDPYTASVAEKVESILQAEYPDRLAYLERVSARRNPNTGEGRATAHVRFITPNYGDEPDPVEYHFALQNTDGVWIAGKRIEDSTGG